MPTALPPLTDEQHTTIRQRHAVYVERHSHMGAFACCCAHASADDVPALLAEVDRLRAERDRLADVLNADDHPLLCPNCRCGDCGGYEHQHKPSGACSCGCRPACDLFQRDSQLDLLHDAVTPLLGDHPLSEAVAHRVWHALNPATQPTT